MTSGQAAGARGHTARRKRSLLQPGLGRTIFLWFLAVSVIPLALISTLSYLSAYRSLRKGVLESLAAVTELKTEYIRSYFDRLLTDLQEQSQSTANAGFLATLRQARRQSGKSARDFTGSRQWELLVHDHAGDLKTSKSTFTWADNWV